MGFFDILKSTTSTPAPGAIANGGQKNTGGHNHQTNRGDDRTPAQKEGDKKRRK